MKVDIDWQFFLNVTDQQKCDKMIEKISEALGIAFCEVISERYWKDDTLFRVAAGSTFETVNSKEALAATMKMLKRLAPTWILTVPPDGEPWEFGGTSNPGAVQSQGVKFISFSASEKQNRDLPAAV